MNLWTPRELCDSVRPERVQAVMAFGFTERQARFVLHVLLYSGVFIERQYRTFTGLAHGQKTHDFLSGLTGRGYATAITPGALHCGRLFHVQYKPLYEAIGEGNNRNRRPASLGRFVERLMLLDAVLADNRYGWLATERDKVAYFVDRLDDLPKEWYPHLTFGEGSATTTRYFPDKLPIGVARGGDRRHVLLYLVTQAVPFDFRLFFLNHADLLKSLYDWTIRLLFPRRFWKARSLYLYAVRDTVKSLMPTDVDALDWFFQARRGQTTDPAPDPDLDLARGARKFGSGRFRALERMWERRGRSALDGFMSNILLDHLQRGSGRIECVKLSHQYLQLAPLIGSHTPTDNPISREDNPGIA